MAFVLIVPVMNAAAGDAGVPGRIVADSARLDNIISPRNRTDGSGAPSVAGAREWNLSAGAHGTLMYSDNVSLAPPGQERADIVTGFTFPLGVRRDGPRLKAAVDYVPTVYLYARNGASNELQNNLRSLMTLEAVEDFFFLDASANVYQSYLSAAGPRPVTGASITDNRTQQTVVGISPYLRHDSSGGWTYLVRNENFWNIYSAQGVSNSGTNRLLVDARSPPARLRLGFDSDYRYTRDQAQPNAYYQQVTRARGIFAVTPRLSMGPRVGYESNDYGSGASGVVYGAGLDWTPTPRTKLEAFLEHRFFGESYGINLKHRTRLTAWSLSATRDAYIAQQQPLALQPGTTEQVLNDALRSELPDPEQRSQAVRQLLQQAGLPPQLTQPYTFYTNQLYIAQQVTGSVGLVGKRNTLELTFIWQQNEPAAIGDLLPVAGSIPSHQKGLRLTLSHSLTAMTHVTIVADRIVATESTSSAAPVQTESTQDTVTVSLTRRLSPKTDASVGLRWVEFNSILHPYRELAILAALGHSF